MSCCSSNSGIPPYPYAYNCQVTFTRTCQDGSGSVTGTVPAAYFSVKFGPDEEFTTQEAAQIQANALAERLARRLALQQILYCNTVTPEDTAGCGLVEERNIFSPACATLYCDGAGNTYCDGDDVAYSPVNPVTP